MNIVELVTNHLSKDVVGSLGSLIGESPDKTKTGLGAAVPALLASFTQLASKPEGARALDAAVSKQDTGILGDLTAAFGSQGSSLTQRGGNLLSSLFGNNLFSGLLGSISNFTGLGQNSARSLLGSLGPLVLGVLSKLKSSLALTRAALSTCGSQKSNFLFVSVSVSVFPSVVVQFEGADSAQIDGMETDLERRRTGAKMEVI